LLLERFPSLDFLPNESCEFLVVFVIVAVSERPVKVRLGHCLHLLAASSLGKWLSGARRLRSQKKANVVFKRRLTLAKKWIIFIANLL
jgi:hypothetical protein